MIKQDSTSKGKTKKATYMAQQKAQNIKAQHNTSQQRIQTRQSRTTFSEVLVGIEQAISGTVSSILREDNERKQAEDKKTVQGKTEQKFFLSL
jgi:hypothetical protein